MSEPTAKHNHHFVMVAGGMDCVSCDARIRAEATASAPERPEPPQGTRLVLMADELMDTLASEERNVTWTWGEPDEHDWYTPTFTRHERPDHTHSSWAGPDVLAGNASPTPTLDAALLARALHAANIDCDYSRKFDRKSCQSGDGPHSIAARAIAREYLRLQSEGGA